MGLRGPRAHSIFAASGGLEKGSFSSCPQCAVPTTRRETGFLLCCSLAPAPTSPCARAWLPAALSPAHPGWWLSRACTLDRQGVRIRSFFPNTPPSPGAVRACVRVRVCVCARVCTDRVRGAVQKPWRKQQTPCFLLSPPRPHCLCSHLPAPHLVYRGLQRDDFTPVRAVQPRPPGAPRGWRRGLPARGQRRALKGHLGCRVLERT